MLHISIEIFLFLHEYAQLYIFWVLVKLYGLFLEPSVNFSKSFISNLGKL